MMQAQVALLIIIFAGLVNGSFVVPIKYIQRMSYEKIWFYHGLIGIGLIPWLLMLAIAPQLMRNYSHMPTTLMMFLVGSGIIFGIGQFVYAYAIQAIGIALSFTINLGIGLTIGSLFVVIYRNMFFTLQGYFVLLALGLILCSLWLSYLSGKHVQATGNQPNYLNGWLLASFTGITSGLQNIAFVVVATYASKHLQVVHAYWVWPPFLLAGAIPMLIGFAYQAHKIPTKIQKAPILPNLLLIVIMGLCFTGSLALYSVGMNQLTEIQQIIGWPALLVSIILVSQFWGFIYKEFSNSTFKAIVYRLTSIALLLAAIVVLAI